MAQVELDGLLSRIVFMGVLVFRANPWKFLALFGISLVPIDHFSCAKLLTSSIILRVITLLCIYMDNSMTTHVVLKKSFLHFSCFSFHVRPIILSSLSLYTIIFCSKFLIMFIISLKRHFSVIAFIFINSIKCSSILIVFVKISTHLSMKNNFLDDLYQVYSQT